MRAMIYSIPGSGTRFTVKYLSEVLGYEQFAPRILVQQPVDADAFTQYHVDFRGKRSATDEKIANAVKEGLVVIVPLRSPVATAISRTKPGGETLTTMKQLWGALKQNIDGFDHILFPIEAPWFDHRRLLELVAAKLKAVPSRNKFEDIVCNWPKVGTTGEKPARMKYDRTGQTILGDYDSSYFDDETAWYIQRLADFAAGAYKG